MQSNQCLYCLLPRLYHLFSSYRNWKAPTIMGPDSSVVRASTSEAVGSRFVPWPGHTKSNENGTGSSLVDAYNKG